MPDNTPGSQPASEPAQANPPAHVDLSQVTPPAPSAAAPATVQPSPDIAALQQQLAAAQQAAQTFEQRFKDTQGAYTRSQQALSALSGNPPNQPQGSPLDPYVKSLVDQGYDPKDAAAMIGVVHQMVAPVLAQSQQAALIAQSSMQVDTTMQAAFAASPQAFANPAVFQQVHRQLQQDAAQGMQIDPGYAAALAKQAWFDATYGPQAQAPGQPPAFTTPQVPNMRSMTGIPGNYGGQQQPSQQPGAIRSPEQVALGSFLTNRIGKQ